MSELVWISVPSGVVSDGKTRVQVVVVPRLDAGGLPAIGNWAARVLAVDFTPELLVNGQCTPFELVSTACADIWDEFFPATTVVTAWQAATPRAAGAIVVRPSGGEETDLITAYAAAAKDIDNPAHVSDVVAQFATARREDPRSATRLARGRRVPPVIEDRPPADFHEVVAGLRDHPVVLRSLGLIFDLVIDAPAEGQGDVRVKWSGAPVLVRSPLTSYVVKGRHFLAAPPDPDDPLPAAVAPPDPDDPLPAAGPLIADGVVDLRPMHGWRLSTIDIDQGMAALDAAQASGRAGSMPAMRSSGITLLHTERSAALLDQADRAGGRPVDLENEVLDAHDLVLGYRVDARIQGGTWFPLGARRATHTVNKVDIVREATDDAHLKPFSLTREGDLLSTDEVVARWTGWGLGSLRPHERETVVDMPTDERPSQEARRQPGRHPQEFTYTWEYVEPEGVTQLPLRYGQKYEMRIRVADIAGGGLGVADPVDSLGTDAVTFLRHEPVQPPGAVTPEGLLVLRPGQPGEQDYRQEVLGPGGEVTTLVVRSDRDQAASAFAAAHPAYPDNSRRTLRPPDTSLLMAEQHGRLDRPMAEAERVFRRGLGLDGEPALPDPMSHGVLFNIAGTGEGSSVLWPGNWPDLAEVPLTVEPLPPGAGMVAATDHEGGILVRLPQGEAVELEIRSLIQQTDHAKFQVNLWLPPAPAGVADPPDLASHSLAAPADRLRLVHAIRRPLLDPSGALRSERALDSPTTQIVPTKPWFGLHRPSAAQVLATASWDDWGDDDQPVAFGVKATLPPLPVPLDVLAGARLPGAVMVHDFRDTRRRDVTYRLQAIGRHRAYFDAGDPPEAFVATASLGLVVVANSGKPPPIDVRNVVPAFRWEGPTSLPGDGALILIRRGGRLRVELGRPWYATGVGELLGVVLNIPDSPDNPAGVLTELARDPIWRTNPPSFVVDEAALKTVGHPESLADVDVLGFPVFLNDGRWYADLVLPVTAYSPLVRLALARYQPESVPRRHLSTITYTDWVPLLPDRTLGVNRQAGRVTVTLMGEDPGPDHDPLITVAVEQRPSGSTHQFTSVEANEPSAWTRVGAASGLLNQEIVVDLPVPGEQALRLVVMEAESHGGPAPSAALSGTLSNRTTYLAQVALSP